MSIKIKTAEEVERMRLAGSLAADILEMIEPHIKEGVTTDELNQICHDYALEKGAYSAPLDYHGFPKSICTSINTSCVTAFRQHKMNWVQTVK